MPDKSSLHDEFGPLPRGINHIGLAVPDLDQASEFLARGLGAKWCYNGLTTADEPRQGPEVERQLGLPSGAQIVRQRLMRIGNGPNIEMRSGRLTLSSHLALLIVVGIISACIATILGRL